MQKTPLAGHRRSEDPRTAREVPYRPLVLASRLPWKWGVAHPGQDHLRWVFLVLSRQEYSQQQPRVKVRRLGSMHQLSVGRVARRFNRAPYCNQTTSMDRLGGLPRRPCRTLNLAPHSRVKLLRDSHHQRHQTPYPGFA
jgi:hypothetical protein